MEVSVQKGKCCNSFYMHKDALCCSCNILPVDTYDLTTEKLVCHKCQSPVVSDRDAKRIFKLRKDDFFCLNYFSDTATRTKYYSESKIFDIIKIKSQI